MSKEPSPIFTLQDAKSAINKAERAWRRRLNALNRLQRERYQTRGEVSLAEIEAERAYKGALATLSEARENLNRIKMTVPKPIRKERPTPVEPFEE